MAVSIEPATPADAPAILALLAASGLPATGALDHLATAVVARAASLVVGCAALEVYADGALLRSLTVDADARGHGVGQQLVRAVLSLADRLQSADVYLLTTTAEAFFPRFGFERIVRADVPAGVRQSVEFQGVCDARATVMRRLAQGRRGDLI